MSHKTVRNKLNEILDFGSDHDSDNTAQACSRTDSPNQSSASSHEINERILRILRSLKELGERIDRLSDRL